MANSKPGSTARRLDDLFRMAVHLRPEAVFGLIAPDIVQGVRSAISLTRLDTQLAPSRFLPDVAYLLDGNEEPAIVVLEGQSRARTHPQNRATMIAVSVGRSAPALEDEPEMRLIELRTRDRSRLAGKPFPGPTGLIHFEPSNALLDLNTDDPRFRAPSTWTILAFSKQVDAPLLDQLIAQMATISHPDHPLSHTIDSTDVYLLGAISRVRFPSYAWTSTTRERLMNNAQNIESSDAGHLTSKERRDLQLQAIMEAREELVRIKAEAEARGEEIGERKVLLELASTFAPERHPVLAELESLADLRREVMALVSSKG